ncbi:MAG: RNA polymerase sigma factor [Acutalibacteraceae bacterium]
MRPFTDEEFDIMIAQIMDEEHPSFDMLYSIADRTLRPTVKNWCACDPALSGKNLEDDIMQDIFCRLIKTCSTHFLIRDDCGGSVNRNPDGFKSWMFKVAENIKRDVANSYRKHDFNTRQFDDGEEKRLPDSSLDDDGKDFRREKLARAFEIVLASDAKIYKVLTWLAQSIFIIQYDITKIQSNVAIIKAFGDKTLFEMRDMVLRFAGAVHWLSVTPAQIEKLNRALNANVGENMLLGDVVYKEFFMKKGGKASISDWVNRMNSMIVSLMNK